MKERMYDLNDYRSYGYNFRFSELKDKGPTAKSFLLEEGKIYMVYDGRLYSSGLMPGTLNWNIESSEVWREESVREMLERHGDHRPTFWEMAKMEGPIRNFIIGSILITLTYFVVRFLCG